MRGPPEFFPDNLSWQQCHNPEACTAVEPQMADAPDRISRALPLFLAEQVTFAFEANVQTFIPWISEGNGGFVLSGSAGTDNDALEYVKKHQNRLLRRWP